MAQAERKTNGVPVPYLHTQSIPYTEQTTERYDIIKHIALRRMPDTQDCTMAGAPDKTYMNHGARQNRPHSITADAIHREVFFLNLTFASSKLPFQCAHSGVVVKYSHMRCGIINTFNTKL